MKTLIFDLDGVLVSYGKPTALGHLASSLVRTFRIVIVTARPTTDTSVPGILAVLNLTGAGLHMMPEGTRGSNQWKAETIASIARSEEVAAVFEDNPGVLAVLARKRIPVVPIYSGYYRG